MATQRYNKEDMLIEWVIKLARGIGIGLLINLVFIITKSFKGLEAGFVAGVVLLCFAYGIGFSYGLFFLKMAWKKAKSTFKRSNAFTSLTSGNFIISVFVFLAVLIIGALIAWILGLVLGVVDIIFALTGRKLLSTTIEEKFGYKTSQPDNIDYEQITRNAVRYNYLTHGTPDAGTPNAQRAFNPTEQQVEKAVEKKRYNLSYWE